MIRFVNTLLRYLMQNIRCRISYRIQNVVKVAFDIFIGSNYYHGSKILS